MDDTMGCIAIICVIAVGFFLGAVVYDDGDSRGAYAKGYCEALNLQPAKLNRQFVCMSGDTVKVIPPLDSVP